ncbi:MAG: GNAT family N-acetyltransferase [Atopobiaceae bacterium]|nr:GNAT family N-acetyltransferase [Atopobiaceae bacterium]
MRIEGDSILIRDFTEDDLPLMLKWLTDDRVLEFYEGRDVRFTMETLAAHYLEEIPSGFRMIIEYRGQLIGYGQVYQLSGELFDEYDYPDNGNVVYAMDLFIGEPDYWNHGIGTAFLQMMAAYLKTSKGADRILLDPRKSNGRAIRAYQKAGFSIVKSLPAHELHEGKEEDCWLMERVLSQNPIPRI